MKNIAIISVLFLLFSCGSKTDENTEQYAPVKNNITFTAEQISMAGIETGFPELKLISSKINCKGKIEAMPENRAKISVPMEGYIKKYMFKTANR